jgi:hypothetical protein
MTAAPELRTDTTSGLVAGAVAATFAAAVAGRDPLALAPALTGAARLRALLPGGLVSAHGRAAVAAFLPTLVADFDSVEVLGSRGEDVGDLLHVHYSVAVGRGTSRWICAQTAVCRVADGRIARIDLLCSGFRRAAPAA